MNIQEINRSEKAKKKIQNIAKANGLPYDWVYALFSFYWNYDGTEGDWVLGLEKDEFYYERWQLVSETLKLSDKIYSKEEMIDEIEKQISQTDEKKLFNAFLKGTKQKNISYKLV